ncbi:MAG: NAD-dependent epimerase/dehydratase family protein [Actinomycetaceae bacterium]|nr:NAD-dependent epimerase/dehydratase family protein [Actinomycetaceae bacterium]
MGATTYLDNPLYHEDCEYVCASGLDWEKLRGKTIAISGATGMVGTFLIDVLLLKNDIAHLDCHVLALGRNEEKARKRLPYFDRDDFSFEVCDVSVHGARPNKRADIILHLASATHPRAYASDPIGTIASNMTGLSNLLEYGVASEADAFVFASSVEIYGENRGDTDSFSEDYLGYIDCNTLRAGYPEAKRAGEALCQAYMAQKNLPVFIPRLPRIFGATVLPSDTKAISQFIFKGVAREDVVLKSEGTQFFSYLHVRDAVCGMLWVLTRGDAGAAYNLADSSCDMSLRDIAAAIAESAGTQVIFDLPDETERAGYSTATRAILNPARAHALGWKASLTMPEGLERTIVALSD